MMRLACVLALVAGCDLYYAGNPSSGGGGSGPLPDAAAATGCETALCAQGTECVLAHGRDGGWTPQCVTPTQAGSCNGPIACDLAVECPQGTTPGVHGICYTPYCIPLDECPPPPPT